MKNIAILSVMKSYDFIADGMAIFMQIKCYADNVPNNVSGLLSKLQNSIIHGLQGVFYIQQAPSLFERVVRLSERVVHLSERAVRLFEKVVLSVMQFVLYKLLFPFPVGAYIPLHQNLRISILPPPLCASVEAPS